MPSDFLNRSTELGSLNRAWEAPGAALILVWGRRRTGKTRLLGEWLRGKRAVFYGATEQASLAELRGLSEATRRSLQPAGSDLLAITDFPDWDRALSYLADRASRERLVVVLDEFPYLADSEPPLPSILQRFWDHDGSRSKLKLVLCGSAQAVMEDLQGEEAPLFGRVDLRLQLKPFDYHEATLFTPRLNAAEKSIAYGVLGGMPVYLDRWDDGVGHRANLRRLFGDPASPLVEEGEFVLSSELPEGSGYFRILHAIAGGHRTYGKIKQFADIDIERQLDRLTALSLVERVVPITEDPSKTKRAVYRIADNFLNFWFRFVYRNRADIARGMGRQVVDEDIVPYLSEFMGEPWEEMCRDFLRSEASADRLPVDVSSIGRWWNTDNSIEIDAVGLRGRKAVLAGSANWSRTVSRAEMLKLARQTEALPSRATQFHLALFARERFDGVRREEALTFTAEDLYRR
jgi:AAA+ ATPase superfamily predicted ATPase